MNDIVSVIQMVYCQLFEDEITNQGLSDISDPSLPRCECRTLFREPKCLQLFMFMLSIIISSFHDILMSRFVFSKIFMVIFFFH